MGDDLCDVLARLGVTTLEDFDRVTFASRHDDPLRSLVSLERGDIQALLDDGLARGVLAPAGALSYKVTDAGTDELQVVLVQVDSDELVMARVALAGEVAAARDALNRVRRSELLDLVAEPQLERRHQVAKVRDRIGRVLDSGNKNLLSRLRISI